jgi:UDP-N-acetyl-D-mannosaminuronate dehydrogenase
LLQDKLNEAKMPLNGTKIGLLGIAYKPNIDDDRESPYYEIVKELRKHKAEIISYDPHIMKRSDVDSMEELLEKSEAIVFVTNHKEFAGLNGKMLKKYDIKVIIDGMNTLDKDDINDSGVLYKGIGR